MKKINNEMKIHSRQTVIIICSMFLLFLGANLISAQVKEHKVLSDKNWQKIKLKSLSLKIPVELKQKNVNCFDSECYAFESEEIYLSIDVSSAVGYPTSQKRYASFLEKTVEIDGSFGKIWHFEENKETDPNYKFKSGVVIFSEKDKGSKVGISIFSKDLAIEELAEKIFKSIKLK